LEDYFECRQLPFGDMDAVRQGVRIAHSDRMDVRVIFPDCCGTDPHVVLAGWDVGHLEGAIRAHLRYPAALRVSNLARLQDDDHSQRLLPARRHDDSAVETLRPPWSQLDSLDIRVMHLQCPLD